MGAAFPQIIEAQPSLSTSTSPTEEDSSPKWYEQVKPTSVPSTKRAPAGIPEPELEQTAFGSAATETNDLLEDASEDALPPPPEWKWRQMLIPVRVAGQISEFDIHPTDPDLMIVGTQEGTILRTDDGGITWREIELDPYVIEKRITIPRPPGLPDLGEVLPPGLQMYQDPPFAPEPVQRVSAPFRTLFFSFGPEFMSVRAANNSAIGFKETILRDALSLQPARPVRRVVFCPGGDFEVLVATDDELLGSTDRGMTFVRLLRIPGQVRMYHVICSERNPKYIYVTTTFGPFLSRDGGITFDQDLSGWPGRLSNGAAFDPNNDGPVFVATDHLLFRGNPLTGRGLEMCYPDFNNASTAPWTQVNWVEISDGQLWLATDDGVRRSKDGGTSWENVGVDIFSRHTIRQVAIGQNESGGKRIVVAARNSKPFALSTTYIPMAESPMVASMDMSNMVKKLIKPTTLVYSSDDNGETWEPFFVGMTRRLISRIKATRPESGQPPKWWILDGGAIWTTAPLPAQDAELDRDSQRWARIRMRDNPPLRNVVERLLYENDLHDAFLQKDWKLQYRSYRLPSIQFRFNMRTPGVQRNEDIAIFAPANILENDRRTAYSASLYLWWDLPNTLNVRDMPGRVDVAHKSARGQLFELKRIIILMVEDLWHERLMHLQTLARGLSDRLKTEILRERIVALEAILETWLRQPLSPDIKPVGEEEWAWQ